MADQSLKDKTVKGTIWSGIDNIAQFGVSFIVSIVLARLLTPDDYGLIGIISIFTAVCTALINGGFTSALIRKKDATDDDYNTSFIVNLGMSLLLYLIIYFCSPFIAGFFYRVELVSLTRVSALGMIIGALALVQQTRLTKLIDFKTQTKITVIASVTSGIIGIVLALFDYGVWALVAQQLACQSIRTILLWLANRWIPQILFSKKSFHDLFGFGWKVMAVGVIDTVWKELYQVVVGKYYSPATLGQYTRAKGFSQLFSSNLTNVIQRVTYPVLSNIQDDKERMIAAYRRIIRGTMFITAISMFFLGAISEPLLYCLIGPQWQEASYYLSLICVSGSFYPLQAINLNMLMVQGRSDLVLKLEIIKKVMLVGPLCVGVLVGIIPMLLVNIIVTILCYFINSVYSGKFIGYTSMAQLKDIVPFYVIALGIALPEYFLKFLPMSNLLILPIQIVTGIIVFYSICSFCKIQEYEEIKKLVLDHIKETKRE